MQNSLSGNLDAGAFAVGVGATGVGAIGDGCLARRVVQDPHEEEVRGVREGRA